MNQNWNNFFMEMCETVALKSRDISTKVGAVIVGPDHEVRSVGYNGFPRNSDDDKLERYERPLKYIWTEHAERNAIYNASRVGIPLKGCTIYISSLPPCVECARAIIQSGISRVIYNNTNIPERWLTPCTQAIDMLTECGVNVLAH